jgi:hypothetical protein
MSFSRRRRRVLPALEQLEARNLMAGTWTPLANAMPKDTSGTADGAGTMLLLPNGTVMVNGTNGNNNDFVSNAWYQLKPDATGSYLNGTWSTLAPMGTQRLYFGADVLPSDKVFVIGGEYSGPNGDQNFSNTAEVYDIASNTWTAAATFPHSQFGDDPTALLPDGTILGGYIGGAQTYAYNPTTNTWTQKASKVNNDNSSDEESWVKLGNGDILSYDIFNSINQGNVPGTAQLYNPATNTWTPTGPVPVQLTSADVPGDPNFFEVGPAILLPDGRAFQIGAAPPFTGTTYTGGAHTALYDPATNKWTAGPDIPAVGVANDDAPAAVLPDGNVIFMGDTPFSNAPALVFEYNPTANTITQLQTPTALTNNLNQSGAFVTRMLMLPTGELLFSDSSGQLWTYSETGTVQDAWRPTISSITNHGGGKYTLTGTQLNGLSEGSYYGDDVQNSSNYPIIRLTDTKGNVFYATSSNWSSVWVATGSQPETTDFQVPAGLPQGNFTVTVIANGIPSASAPLNGLGLQLNLGPQVEGQAFTNATVATITDPSGTFPPSDYTATIDWGDGTSSAGTVVSGSANTLAVQGSHTYLEEGKPTVKVTVTNTTNSLQGATSGSITVADAALKLKAFNPPTGYPVGVPAPVDLLDFTDNDPNGAAGDYTATVTWGDGSTSTFNAAGGGILSNADGSFSVFGGHAYAATGNYTLSVQVKDAGGSSLSATGTLTVVPSAVQFQSVTPPQGAVEGQALTATLATFTDKNANASFTATVDWGDGSRSTLTSAGGGVVGIGGGAFAVVGSHAYLEEGNGLPFGISITDSTGAINGTAATVSVQDAGLTVRSVGGPTGLQEGSTATATVATFSDADPNGAAGDYTATVQWGDGASSTLTASGGGIVANPGGGFSVVGSHAYAEEGSYNLAVRVQDAGGASITGTGTALVADAPLQGTAVSFSSTEGQNLTNTVVAHFTDTAQGATNPAIYSATLSWTDATGSHTASAPIQYSGSGTTFDVLGGSAVLATGSYGVTVTVRDQGSASVAIPSTATISDAPLAGAPQTLQAVEGQPLSSVVVAQFTDGFAGATNPGSYTATISYTDAAGTHNVAGLISYSGSGSTFTVRAPSLAFAQAGSVALSVVVVDNNGSARVTIPSRVSVGDAPLLITGAPASFSGTEGGTMSNALVASFADSNALATPGDVASYSATVTWDDGLGQSHTSAGRIQASGNAFAVYADDSVPMLQGQHSVTVTINDIGGASVSTADLVTVGPGPDAPSASGNSLSVTEGQAFSAVLGGYVNLDQPSRAVGGNTVQIDWGDGTSSAGSLVPVAAGQFQVTGTHTYQEEGNYTATYTVTAAGAGSSVQGSTSFHVADAPLTLTMTPPSVVLAGQTLNGYPVATFSDADTFHALGDYSAQISWGDGAVTAGAIRDNGNGTYSVLGSHVYGSVGSVTLGVTVHDAGGAGASAASAVPGGGGGVATPLFLGDAAVPAANPLSPLDMQMAMFQAFEAWFFQELQLFFAMLSGG